MRTRVHVVHASYLIKKGAFSVVLGVFEDPAVAWAVAERYAQRYKKLNGSVALRSLLMNTDDLAGPFRAEDTKIPQ